VERGDVEDDAVVEVGFQAQVRGPAQLVLEVAQLRDGKASGAQPVS